METHIMETHVMETHVMETHVMETHIMRLYMIGVGAARNGARGAPTEGSGGGNGWKRADHDPPNLNW